MSKKEIETAGRIIASYFVNMEKYKAYGMDDEYTRENTYYKSYKEKLHNMLVMKWEVVGMGDYEKEVIKVEQKIFTVAADIYGQEKAA